MNMLSHSNWKYKGPYYYFFALFFFLFFYKLNNFFKNIKIRANKYICRDAHSQFRQILKAIYNCSNYSLLHIITQHMHTWMQNFMYFCFFYVFLLYKYIDFRIYQEDVALGSEKTLWTILFTMNRVQIGVLI